MGAASSVVAFFRAMGGAIGVSALGPRPSAPVREVFQTAFEDATAHIFLLAVPFTVVALLAVLFIREVPLRTTIEREDELQRVGAGSDAEIA